MQGDVTLFGKADCAKTRHYQAELTARGVGFKMADVSKNPEAAARLTALTGSAQKFPTLLIKGRKLRNPDLADLDKALARAGLYDPGLVHEPRGQRFVRYMAPTDAFVSYSWQSERMVLGHIEVAGTLQGAGHGTRLATEVFEHLATLGHEVRLSCPFLRMVALTRPTWRNQFNIKD